MRIYITGKNIEVSEYLENIIEKQVKKLDKYFDSETEIFVTMALEGNRHVVEVSIPAKSGWIRASETTGDMYASVNSALKKIERRLIKHRTKMEQSFRSGAFYDMEPVFGESIEPEDLMERKVVKVKHFALKPMTVDEAIMQLELVGHAFYVFTNGDTGKVNVLYQRNDSDYGLITPED